VIAVAGEALIDIVIDDDPRHPGAALVLLTDGPRASHAFAAGLAIRVDVPTVPVIDTIGAGDAFGGAFLAWWAGHGRTRSDLANADDVASLLRLATQVAALNAREPALTRPGPPSYPPTRRSRESVHPCVAQCCVQSSAPSAGCCFIIGNSTPGKPIRCAVDAITSRKYGCAMKAPDVPPNCSR
jgi:hypothetical protein